MQYFWSAEKQIVPPSPHHGRQGAEVVGVLILQVLVCSDGCQMTHEHCGAQHYDGHDQIQFAVAIYVRVQIFFRGDGGRLN